MSGPRLSALDGEGANLVPFAKRESVSDLLGTAQGLEERRGTQTPTDDKAANSVGCVNKSINNFDLWRLFQENSGIQMSAFKHATHPSYSVSEQRDVEPDNVNQINILTLGKGRFLPAVSFERQSAGSVASSNAVELTTQPVIANDLWHPLGAA